MIEVILWNDDDGRVVATTVPAGMTAYEAINGRAAVPYRPAEGDMPERGAVDGVDAIIPPNRSTFVVDGSTLPLDIPLDRWRLSAEGAVTTVAPEPPPELPIVVSRLRFKLELADRDMLATVSILIAGLPGADGDLARLYWAEATEFESDHALVLTLAALLDPPLSAPEVRAMFEAARDREA